MQPQTILVKQDLEPITLSPTQIGFDTFRGGVYLFIRQEPSMNCSVVYIPLHQQKEVKSCLEKVIGPQASLKILGDRSLRETIKNCLNPQFAKVLGEGDVGPGSKLYFCPMGFKIRVEKSVASTIPLEKDPNRVRKVFVVDDSGTMRKVLKQTLEASPLLQVAGETGRPSEAEALISKIQPDVITLDIHMPEMDGITLLKKLHQKFDIPVVMISSVSRDEGVEILKALEYGAVDYIEKPRFDQMEEHAANIIEKVLVASDVVLKKSNSAKTKVAGGFSSMLPVVIGSSTGGTEALREVLTALPKDIPPILVVQHIPALFSEALARRLNDLCPFNVREAKDGDNVQPGTVLIAPGGLHMTVTGSTRSSTVRISDKPDGFRHKPAVDVLFDSAGKAYRGDCSAVILTGMGKDGAEGMKKLRDLGALTIGQDKDSCVVYGMPRAAFEIGAVQKQLPLSGIPDYLAKSHGKAKKAA